MSAGGYESATCHVSSGPDGSLTGRDGVDHDAGVENPRRIDLLLRRPEHRSDGSGPVAIWCQGRWSRHEAAWWCVMVPPRRMIASDAASLMASYWWSSCPGCPEPRRCSPGRAHPDTRTRTTQTTPAPQTSSAAVANRTPPRPRETPQSDPRDRRLEAAADHPECHQRVMAMRQVDEAVAPTADALGSRVLVGTRQDPAAPAGQLDRACHPRVHVMVGRLERNKQHRLACRSRRRRTRPPGDPGAGSWSGTGRTAQGRARPPLRR